MIGLGNVLDYVGTSAQDFERHGRSISDGS